MILMIVVSDTVQSLILPIKASNNPIGLISLGMGLEGPASLLSLFQHLVASAIDDMCTIVNNVPTGHSLISICGLNIFIPKIDIRI